MRETFGQQLKQFALAGDIVDKDTFHQVWELVRQYVTQDLKLTYWALLVEGEVNYKSGLQAHESSSGSKIAFNLKTDEGSYNGLAAYAFAEAKKLWIADQQPLNMDTHLRDAWSNTNTQSLPAYHQSRDVSIKTVILIPLCWQERTFGVLDLQMSEYYEPTNTAKVELERLVDTLSELLVLSETNQMQRKHRQQAIDMLKTALAQKSWSPLIKPQLFVASSHRADPQVMGTISRVLKDFEGKLRIHYWRQNPRGGNITWDTLTQVKASRFGLFYFSEPVEDAAGELSYQDNANVVFEAGMFQSLTNPATRDDPIGWIPVREEKSPPAPFDFAQERMIYIERQRDDSKPNLDQLAADLQARIKNLLETV